MFLPQNLLLTKNPASTNLMVVPWSLGEIKEVPKQQQKKEAPANFPLHMLGNDNPVLKIF